ncbi:type VI secretion system baseplate subunit TssG [Acidocella sp.]|uniref:type VI secretion system baseplate subunit TssG n=1 Tax=Acidocella sp. TaxID=50710 RepID=UPI00260D2E4A|nr:type VI secretion system baseplate subunit TssG [Acidocella sp.]
MSAKSPLEHLKALPQAFRFDAAVRLLLAAAKAAPPGPNAPGGQDDQIAFIATPVLSQPVAEITAVELPAAGRKARLTSPMLGLVGPSGVMPRWYTELVAQAARAKSRAIVDFFDLLGQRLIMGFARAGTKYRLHRSAEMALLDHGREEPIGAALLAFTGYGTAHLADRLPAGADALRHYAGYFAARPRAADRLAQMVSDYLGRRAEIIEFAGAWLPVPADQQSRLPRGRLAGAFHALGVDAAIGTRAWDQQARFIVRIGPLNRPDFEALLPDRPALRELVSLIRAYVGWEADFAINLVLSVSEIPPLRMAGREEAAAPRLGWTSWLPSSTSHLRGQDTADETMFSATMVEALPH